MAETTNISWCDHTFNPWVGCERISPACDSCYAATWAKRAGHPELWKGERRRTTPANWVQPLKWDAAARAAGTRVRVFCASLADVFDNQIDTQWRADLFGLIRQTPHLDWLLLTKRVGNVVGMIEELQEPQKNWWPLSNCWLGATIANQAEADRDIPKLLATPARVRFLSCEPLLGPIDLRDPPNEIGEPRLSYLRADEADDQQRIDWVIAGGESGGKARPSHPDWFRSLRDQCAAAGVAYHFKQWGEWVGFDESAKYGLPCKPRDHFDFSDDVGERVFRVGKKAAGRTLDGVIHDAFPTEQQ